MTYLISLQTNLMFGCNDIVQETLHHVLRYEKITLDLLNVEYTTHGVSQNYQR